MANPAVKDEPAPAQGPSMMMTLIVALLLSLAGGGGGWAIGTFFLVPADVAAPAPEADAHGAAPADKGGHGDAAKPDAKADAHGAKPEGAHGDAAKPAEGGHAAPAADAHGGTAVGNIVSLAPVVTNIAAPSDVWVRLEAVLKVTEPLEEGMAEEIHDDYMAFFRTARLRDLQGGSAFVDLKAELAHRARLRSADRVSAVFIKTFLFE